MSEDLLIFCTCAESFPVCSSNLLRRLHVNESLIDGKRIDAEYAYSSKPTGKCDVYSFGVVLMELISGRKPLDPEFGESQNIVFWISCKASTKEGAAEVLDKRLSAVYKDDMIHALRIAMRCTCSLPALRPAMNEVVTMLIEADPHRLGSCKSLHRVKDLPRRQDP